MQYDSCVRAGWNNGIHDCRAYRYQHPWVVIYKKQAVGCWSRAEARRVLRALKSGASLEACP